MRSTVSFSDFSAATIFSETRKIFTTLFGISMDFWNPQNKGEKIFEHKERYANSFCEYIYRNNKVRERCRRSDINALEEAMKTGKPYVYKCFAGFTEIAIPILIDGNIKLVLFTGQFLPVTPNKSSLHLIQQISEKYGMDPEILYDKYCSSMIIPEEKQEELVKLLSIFCNYIAKLGNEILLLQRKEESDIVGRVKEYVLKNFMNENICMKNIVDYIHLSPSHVSRMFHKQTGVTLTRFINDVRIEEARKLLISTKMTVSEVCYAVGYKSLSNFTKMFKKNTELSPKNFRMNNSIIS